MKLVNHDGANLGIRIAGAQCAAHRAAGGWEIRADTGQVTAKGNTIPGGTKGDDRAVARQIAGAIGRRKIDAAAPGRVEGETARPSAVEVRLVEDFEPARWNNCAVRNAVFLEVVLTVAEVVSADIGR